MNSDDIRIHMLETMVIMVKEEGLERAVFLVANDRNFCDAIGAKYAKKDIEKQITEIYTTYIEGKYE